MFIDISGTCSRKCSPALVESVVYIFRHVYDLLMFEFKSATPASSSESDVRTTQLNVHMPASVVAFLTIFPQYGFMMRLRWSSGQHAGLWYPRSRVRSRPKPAYFSGEKFHSMPSLWGEVKPSSMSQICAACQRTLGLRGSRNHRQNSPAISRP